MSQRHANGLGAAPSFSKESATFLPFWAACNIKFQQKSCFHYPNHQPYRPSSVLARDHLTGCQQGPSGGKAKPCSEVPSVPNKKSVTAKQSPSAFAWGRLPWQADSAPKQQPGTHSVQKEAVCQLVNPYLFHHHSELAFCAENGLHTREPLHTGKDFRRPDEDLPGIKAIWIIKEKTLWGKRGKNNIKGLSFKIPAFLFPHPWSGILIRQEKVSLASCPSLKVHSPPEINLAVSIATYSITHSYGIMTQCGRSKGTCKKQERWISHKRSR